MTDFTRTWTGDEYRGTPDDGTPGDGFWAQFPIEQGPDFAMYLLEACDEASRRGETMIDVSDLIEQTADAVRSAHRAAAQRAASRPGLRVVQDT